MSVPHRYQSGSGKAIALPGVAVLIGSDAPAEAGSALWSSVQEAQEPQDVIDAVLAVGLRRLPSVGILHSAGQVIHLLIRGTVHAEVVSDDGTEMVSAADALTWVEQAVPAGTSVTLRIGDSSDNEWLPLVAGVVLATSVAEEPGLAAEPEPTAAATESQRGDAGVVPTSPISLEVPTPGSFAGVTVGTPATPEEITSLPGSARSGGDGDLLGTLTAPEFIAQAGADAPLSPRLGASAGAAPTLPVVDDDNFDDLFGTTRAPMPVEHAAVRPAEPHQEEEGEELPPSVGRPFEEPELVNIDPVDPPLEPQPEPVVLTPGATRGTLIESVPGMASAAPSTAVWPAMADDDHADMTMSRSHLDRIKGAGSLGEAVKEGPPVHGIFCPSGHPNPPSAVRCRQCEARVEAADPVTMPRPVLGVLRFSNGMEVVLDRSAVIGRSPRAERVSASEIPQLVVVPSPESGISRSHVEVRLEGWHVLLVDLDSTNGTVVTSPGQPPERLRPREECPIVPGATVTIAEEISFTYEVGS